VYIGEWWKSRVEDVYEEFISSGGTPNTSDAITINGQPGDLYPCSRKGTHQDFTLHSSTQAYCDIIIRSLSRQKPRIKYTV